MTDVGSRETLRFGDFELNLAAYELRRNGKAVRLERQPMDLLVLLVERRGDLVTRAEIVNRLWGPDVFVDVETGGAHVFWLRCNPFRVDMDYRLDGGEWRAIDMEGARDSIQISRGRLVASIAFNQAR